MRTLDVVVVGAEYGHGKRAGVLSDYTFAVRDGDVLKTIGKAFSGLTRSSRAGTARTASPRTASARSPQSPRRRRGGGGLAAGRTSARSRSSFDSSTTTDEDRRRSARMPRHA